MSKSSQGALQQKGPNSPSAPMGCTSLEGGTYQQRVMVWMNACFSGDVTNSPQERAFRFLEEALELAQAMGATEAEARALVSYTFARPKGEVFQEAGGVMVCLAALCGAVGEDMDAAAEAELARVWTKIDKIRAKHAAKPKDVRTALPGDLSTGEPPQQAAGAEGPPSPHGNSGTNKRIAND
jgi:NTP pyrophosphatase (non-canonical NTP hydrolase)